MKRLDIKSKCPVNFALETFGDPWSLIIIRDMASTGKSTFSEFLESEERIGRSVLAERLAHLQQRGIITKQTDPSDKRTMHYILTVKGVQAIPLLYELTAWGSIVSSDSKASEAWFAAMKLDKLLVIEAWQKALISGSSFRSGPSSVVKRLNL